VGTSDQKKDRSGSPKSNEWTSESPVFNEPWEAEALALAILLQDAGQFTAVEWSEALGAEIRAAQARGDPDDGTTYYRHVLAALERLVRKKGLASRGALLQRRRDWEAAYRVTPHGRPVTLATPADGAKGRRGAGRSQRP
jgi:nitrile hydratase accessory protein